jgi:NAD(P)-dependent dehydrogenase (short-subunit alcohol dehydrogenase family)
MQIHIDDPTYPDVYARLDEHLRNMHQLSPPESVHALNVSGLKSPDITFWTVREGELLLGCGALKELDSTHGEVKSMRTPLALRGRGAGRALLAHIVRVAHERGYPSPHHFASIDVSDDGQVEAWAAEVLKTVGTPDLLINNAALMNMPAPLWTIPAQDFDTLIDVNVIGVANVIRHFVPAMIEAGRGVIVNLSSGWGRSTSAGVAPYCASKFAIEGLTKALAQDLPKGLAAVPLSPGIIATDMLRSAFGDSAGSHESPEHWAARALPQILKLGPHDSGKSISIA